jgi:anhydro-N-acetylmuramic acid kinase
MSSANTAFSLTMITNGEIAAQVEPDVTLLNHLLSHPYFKQAAPKSTGRDIFNQAWWSQYTNPTLSPQQVLSTLNQLTVETVALELDKLNLPAQTTCLICGGGAYNKTLLQRLQLRCPTLKIGTTASLNIDPNAIEAMMCAWLAKQRLDHTAIDLTQISRKLSPSNSWRHLASIACFSHAQIQAGLVAHVFKYENKKAGSNEPEGNPAETGIYEDTN